MKKISIFIVIVVIGMCSCTSYSSRKGLKTDVDTLSYYFGLSRADGIKNYLTVQAGVDTAYMEDFYKGFRHVAKNYAPEDVAYYEGVRIAHLINNQCVENINRDIFLGDSGRTINRKAVLSGFYNGVKRYDDLAVMRAQTYSQTKMNEIKERYKLEKYAESIVANEKFLAENKNKADVTTT